MIKENLSVVLIAHNEEGVIGRVVDGVLSNYRDKILEVIVVDDVSTDSTAAIVEAKTRSDPKVKLVRRTPPCGVGRAIKTGFKSVDPKASYVLTMDSDFVESIGDIGRLIARMEAGDCDGVIGSRFVEGSRLEVYPLTKKIMNRLFHCVARALFSIKQKDLSNNFKLYKREVIEKMPWRSDDFSINAETGILPILSGYRVCEVPVSWVGRNAGQGQSKFKLFKVGWGYIKVIPYALAFRHSIKKSSAAKKMPHLILVVSLLLLQSVCKAQDYEDDSVKEDLRQITPETANQVPLGMELRRIGGINMVVPEGTQFYKEGSQLKMEEASEYSARRFWETTERINKLEEKTKALEERLNNLEEKQRKTDAEIEYLRKPVIKEKEASPPRK